MGIGFSQVRWARRSLLAIAIAMPLAALAQERESDNPGARAQAMDEWYNDNYAQHGRRLATPVQKKPLFSQSYEQFMLRAAKRERERYAPMMPASGTSATMIDPNAALVPGGTTWTNIGPTKADYMYNGVTLNVTDTGRVNAIVTDPANPSTIYVAFSGGGVWKSTDGGAFWQAKTETLGSLSVGALEMDPNAANTLYLGLGDPFDGTGIGLVKSTDGGDTWSDPVFLGTSTVISDIQVTPGNSNIVLAATNRGLFRSTDAGASFSNVSIVPTGGGIPVVWSLAWGGGSNFVLSLLGGTSDGEIWRSTDNGATWTQSSGLAAGIGRISLDAAPSNRSVMYATAAKPSGATTSDLVDIYKSTDDGATWTGVAKNGNSFKNYSNTNGESSSISQLLRGQGWYNHMTLVSPTDPNTAYFGGALLMAKTTDGGTTFSQATNWLAQFGLPYVHADFHAGHIASNGTLYVGTDGGIFASGDGGASFTDTLNEGIASHLVYQVGSSPANRNAVIVGLQDNGTRVRDGSTSVFNQTIGGDGFGCNINRSNPSLMLGSLYYERIRKSTDGGLTFASACSGITECNNSSTAPFITRLSPWAGDATGNTLYTYSNTKVYKTVDYAGNWTALGTTGLPTSGLFIRGVGSSPSSSGGRGGNPRAIGVVANGGRLFLSKDGGTTWAAPAAPLPNNGLSLSWISFDTYNSDIVYVASVAPDQTRNHLWKSTNSGASWSTIDSLASGFPAGIPVNTLVVDPMASNTLYAGTHLGVYTSTDGGSSWTRHGTGMPLVNVTDLYVANDGSVVRAATFGRSVWELPLPATQTYSNATAMPITFGSQVDSTITVAGRSGNAPVNAKVSVNLSHARRGDLQIDLVAPDNSVYPLKASNAADFGKNVLANYTVDLSSEALNGTWTLRVQDVQAANNGTLNSWSITF